MKVLLTGANGFLGHYLTRLLLAAGLEVIATGKGVNRLPFDETEGFNYIEMDFTDPHKVNSVFEKCNPAVVIHAGAMSKPDECELNQPQAYKTNAEGTMILLAASAAHTCHFIFVSTDFIFDGTKGMYKEDDLANPLNYYGKTKVDAEIAVKAYQNDWAIVRTVLVYGNPLTGRGNLLTVIKEKLEKGEEYKVFNDQVRTPTYVEDLAAGIVSVVKKRATGIFHLSGTDILTPYEMAKKAAIYLGLNGHLLKKVTAADFSQPASRPLKTGFQIDKAKNELAYSPLSFDEGLVKTFQK